MFPLIESKRLRLQISSGLTTRCLCTETRQVLYCARYYIYYVNVNAITFSSASAVVMLLLEQEHFHL